MDLAPSVNAPTGGWWNGGSSLRSTSPLPKTMQDDHPLSSMTTPPLRSGQNSVITDGLFSIIIAKNTKHSEFFDNLEIKGGQLRDREIEIIGAMIIDPKSEEEYAQNLKCVKDLLSLEKQKYNFLQDFAAYIGDVGKRKKNQNLLTNAARLNELSKKRYDLGKSYANKLIEYHNSRDEALLEASEAIMADLITLRDEITETGDRINSFFEK